MINDEQHWCQQEEHFHSSLEYYLLSVTPVAADVDLSSEVHHQSRIAYIGIGFERWVNPDYIW
ncbi:hypothetical protein T02_3122 [Trichinella nativa]|uniref:Uncharacterized protein n=1 Tax=Trichinella nativa TaxID=6335 RepID=A0A0V1KSY5_9BILA|nr:hypothetical protein T02_3122 [Trichinella nativa]